jgi:hypothetical protein
MIFKAFTQTVARKESNIPMKINLAAEILIYTVLQLFLPLALQKELLNVH